MRNILIILLNLFVLITSCNSQKKLDCINELRKSSKDDTLTQKLKYELRDSIKKWQKMGVPRYKCFDSTEKWYWDDLIIFNETRNRAISFIYEIEVDTTTRYPNNIFLYGVEFKDNHWNYYLAGMPTISFFKNKNGGKPYSLEQLKFEAMRKLANSIEGDNCENIGDLVDSWFTPEQGLEKSEINFWKKYYESKNKEK